MNRYKEIKEIAKCVAKIKRLVCQLENNLDTDGIEWETAEFVTLTKEDRKHFENTNGVTEDYYVTQYMGYLGDDFYGYLYFATDVPGQFVKVHFSSNSNGVMCDLGKYFGQENCNEQFAADYLIANGVTVQRHRHGW